MDMINFITLLGVALGIFSAWLFGGISSYFVGRKTIGGDLAFFMGGMFGIVSGVPTIVVGVIIIIFFL